MPYDIEEKFSFGAVEDFHQIANGFLPNVQSMLPSATSAYVLSIARETAFLPCGSIELIVVMWKKRELKCNLLINEILKLLNWFRFAVLSLIDYLSGVIHSNHTIRGVNEKGAVVIANV